jgi:hypothetical protein
VPTLVQRTAASLDQIRQLAAGGSLFAILDACGEPAVLVKCKQLGKPRALSLYRGTAEQTYRKIAPYLVHLDSATVDWIAGSVWLRPWGIFAHSPHPFPELHQHFRRFLKVELPDGARVLLRFYDPRLLPVFLDSCQPAELRDFFGPVRAFGVPDQTGQPAATLLHFPSGGAPGSRPVYMKIRPEQMRLFEENAQFLFESRAIRHLREALPSQASAFDDHQLRSRVRTAADQAGRYGFSTEQEIMCFVDTTFFLGPRFDQDPYHAWTRGILDDRQAPASRRAFRLLDEAERSAGPAPGVSL